MVFSHSQMFHFPGRIHGNWYTIAIHRSQYVFLQVFEAREAQRNSFARDYKVCLGWHLVGLIFTACGFCWEVHGLIENLPVKSVHPLSAHALRHIVRNSIPNRSSVWPCLVMVGATIGFLGRLELEFVNSR